MCQNNKKIFVKPSITIIKPGTARYEELMQKLSAQNEIQQKTPEHTLTFSDEEAQNV